jgi:hypothetical protein
VLPSPQNLPATPAGEAASIARYARLQRLAEALSTYPPIAPQTIACRNPTGRQRSPSAPGVLA